MFSVRALLRRFRSPVAIVVAGLLPLAPLPAGAQERPWFVPPVDAPIERGFDLPKGQYGPGNRGLEYAVVEGTSVRAAGAGTVAFAGPVAGRLAVSIDHAGDLVSTYTGMRQIYVARGDEVDQSHWLGETTDTFHFGVKLEDVYVDPQDYLGPIDTGEAIHLIPVREKGPWTQTVERLFGREFDGLDTLGCTPRTQAQTPHRRAPNPNVAVMVGGINKGRTPGGTEDIAGTAAALGYGPEKSFVFSYSDDPDGYERTDTFGDLREAALRLDSLLQRIAREHPGSRVDILAHSQGGLVARYYLETAAREWDSLRPTVDHLVTFSAPHQGAPIADTGKELEGLWSGKLALDGIHRAHQGEDPSPIPDSSRWGHPTLAILDAAWFVGGKLASRVVPDPYARSIQQMRSGSEFLRNLATDDVSFGTRVLALQDRYDLVVPASHARWPGETNRTVDGNPGSFLGGLNRHRGILDNPEALGMAHGFLRGTRPTCLDERDRQAWDSGRRIAGATALVPLFWQVGEEAALSVALKGKAPALKAAVREGSTLWRLLRARGFRGVLDHAGDKVTYVIRNPREVLEWLATQRLEAELEEAVTEMLRVVVEAEEGP
jgi:Peptidase family M23/Palmitoyl protein thioesterase